MNDITAERTGTTVTLVYWPGWSEELAKRSFHGLTDDDVVFIVSGLAGRRYETPALHAADMRQLKASREAQMRWYADRMLEALYDGMGRWFKWVPLRVRRNTVQLLMDYLRDITAVWTNELVAVHAEVARTHEQARVLRPAPAPEPLVSCRCCSATFERADFLPEGWTADDDAFPRCPKHRVVTLVKDRVG
jgi:hypothetical protein